MCTGLIRQAELPTQYCWRTFRERRLQDLYHSREKQRWQCRLGAGGPGNDECCRLKRQRDVVAKRPAQLL